MMAGLGNSAANAVYESSLPQSQEGTDSWVMAEDPDGNSGESLRKPGEGSSSEAREKFVTAKYKEQKFVTPSKHDQDTLLLVALRRNNLKGAMQAMARGARINKPLTLQYSQAIMEELDEICPLRHQEESFVHGDGIPAILGACKAGDKSLLEFLFWNGASKNSIDTEGRSLLHYAIILKRTELASYFIKRGVDKTMRDKDGQTAMDVARSTGFPLNFEMNDPLPSV